MEVVPAVVELRCGLRARCSGTWSMHHYLEAQTAIDGSP